MTITTPGGGGCCGIHWGIETHEPWCPSLDAAWAEAEAALPEGWDFGITLTKDHLYRASAARISSTTGVYVVESTPAAALRALAAKLRERAG